MVVGDSLPLGFVGALAPAATAPLGVRPRKLMGTEDGIKMKIATSSPEEGLDFACNLIAIAVSRDADSHPERACELLRTLAQYVEFRYVGELQLAAECLADLARMISRATSFQREQFWRQMQWVAQAMGLPVEDYSEEKR